MIDWKLHTGLVHSIARGYSRVCASLSVEDLVQDGMIGLLKACERFDPARGKAFSTYASYWIKHCIRRSITNTDRLVRLPVHKADSLYRVGELKRERVAHLDAPLSEDGGSLHDVLPSDADPEAELERVEREELARELLTELDDGARDLMVARFWDERTLAEIGASRARPCTRERVRQLEADAFTKMRRAASA